MNIFHLDHVFLQIAFTNIFYLLDLRKLSKFEMYFFLQLGLILREEWKLLSKGK